MRVEEVMVSDVEKEMIRPRTDVGSPSLTGHGSTALQKRWRIAARI